MLSCKSKGLSGSSHERSSDIPLSLIWFLRFNEKLPGWGADSMSFRLECFLLVYVILHRSGSKAVAVILLDR